jgi:hypothetical protein
MYMYIGLHVKYPLFLSDFNESWIFSTGFKKVFKHQISWKSVQSWVIPWGRAGGQTDRQTDRQDEANSRFSQFCERA